MEKVIIIIDKTKAGYEIILFMILVSGLKISTDFLVTNSIDKVRDEVYTLETHFEASNIHYTISGSGAKDV